MVWYDNCDFLFRFLFFCFRYTIELFSFCFRPHCGTASYTIYTREDMERMGKDMIFMFNLRREYLMRLARLGADWRTTMGVRKEKRKRGQVTWSGPGVWRLLYSVG